MDELKEKIKKALDESETYGEFYFKLIDMPEFREELKVLRGENENKKNIRL